MVAKVAAARMTVAVVALFVAGVVVCSLFVAAGLAALAPLEARGNGARTRRRPRRTFGLSIALRLPSPHRLGLFVTAHTCGNTSQACSHWVKWGRTDAGGGLKVGNNGKAVCWGCVG